MQAFVGDKRCSWCDAELVIYGRPRRVARRKSSPWTDGAVEQCHLTYLEGHSTPKIAEAIYRRLGFATAASCAKSLDREFRMMGLPVRSRAESTAKRNFKHGRGARELRRTPEGEKAYRAWLKDTEERLSPPCGRPGCGKPAMRGDDYCYAHSDQTRAQREAHAAAMRATSPLTFGPGEKHPMAKLTDAQAAQIKSRVGESPAALAEEFGCTPDTVRDIQAGRSWIHIDLETREGT
jgi:hypothetical protein